MFLAYWDATDRMGRTVGNGMYFIRLTTDTRIQTRRRRRRR